DDLKNNSINPVASLQGKVAGVEISGSDGGMFGSTKIQIRGASTLKGNNQPIYVIDGVILDNSTGSVGDADWSANAGDYGNELKNLNPDDFETVSVLKGAASTALYGSRGLNGAVVITTKGGGKFKGYGVNFSQTFGVDHVFKTPDLQNVYGEGAMSGYVDYGEKDGSGNYYKFDNLNQFVLNAQGQHTLIDTWGMSYGPAFDGSPIELYDRTMGKYNAAKNNFRDAFDLGFNSNTNVSVQGGNDKTTFYSSLSYKYAEGTLPNNSFDRLALMVKASHKISEIVDVAGSVSFANSRPKNAQPNIGEYFAQGTFNRSYDPDYYKTKYLGEHGGLASNNYGDLYGNVWGSGLWFGIYENEYTQKETAVRPMLELNIKMTDWMRFKAEANMNYYYNRAETKELGTGYANEGGRYRLSQFTKEQTTIAGTFTFNKPVNDFNVGGFIRGEYYNNFAQTVAVQTEGGLIVPGQYFLSNSKNPVSTGDSRITGTKQMLSAVFAANLSWKNQVFLDITGRNDWSSALIYTNKSGNYSYFYPSVSGSWLLNETFTMPQWISLAKVRASWAQVGNDTQSYYINQGYSLGTTLQSNGSIYSLSVPTKAYDPSLKPERKNAFEIGLDWRFLDSRINLDATYYKENTKDQIMDISVPNVSGINQQLINAGNIQNQGIEIALNTVPFRNKDWEWDLDFTYTRNRNKIIELHPNVANYIALKGDVTYGNYRIGSVAMVGGEYGLLLTDSKPAIDEATGKKILRFTNNGRTAYYARSGKIEEIGSLTPDFLGSVSTGLRWKNLNLRVALDMRYGGYVASYNNRYGTAYGYTEGSLKYRDEAHGGITWTSQYANTQGVVFHDGVVPDGIFATGTMVTTPAGTSVNVGGLTYQEAMDKGYVEPSHASGFLYFTNSWGQGVVNDGWVTKLNYIALREISLGYNMPQNISSLLGAKNLSLVFSARNLGYLYNTMPNNVNPEGVRGNDATEFRERSFSPYTANYMLTINVGF
ncbi:MAG: SusC/RagA family TonB-linked outer membrane protein, partial [Tannerellaceae bacterium]|nr:SusC/RagA family TonB-linked outer membrane protein [Tannerellaceae bacterium]